MSQAHERIAGLARLLEEAGLDHQVDAESHAVHTAVAGIPLGIGEDLSIGGYRIYSHVPVEPDRSTPHRLAKLDRHAMAANLGFRSQLGPERHSVWFGDAREGRLWLEHVMPGQAIADREYFLAALQFVAGCVRRMLEFVVEYTYSDDAREALLAEAAKAQRASEAQADLERALGSAVDAAVGEASGEPVGSVAA